jgi:hypothetical protein
MVAGKVLHRPLFGVMTAGCGVFVLEDQDQAVATLAFPVGAYRIRG